MQQPNVARPTTSGTHTKTKSTHMAPSNTFAAMMPTHVRQPSNPTTAIADKKKSGSIIQPVQQSVVHHARSNSNKYGISPILKTSAQTKPSSASASATTGGHHKKSQSMANQKLNELLLKGAS